MEYSKKIIAKLYKDHSIGEISTILNISRSKVYSLLHQYKIPTRSKSEAQKKHLSKHGHPLKDKKVSDKTKIKIQKSCAAFWQSKDGDEVKNKIIDGNKERWAALDELEMIHKINLLNENKKSKNDLSRIGEAFSLYLKKKNINIKNNFSLIPKHKSDIILLDEGVVIEFIIPMGVYGPKQGETLHKRYAGYANSLSSKGYKVLIVEDKASHVSIARCERIYQEVSKLLKSKKKWKTIIS